MFFSNYRFTLPVKSSRPCEVFFVRLIHTRLWRQIPRGNSDIV